jgi:hypothetical protein
MKDGDEEILEDLTCLEGLIKMEIKLDLGLKPGTLKSDQVTKPNCLQTSATNKHYIYGVNRGRKCIYITYILSPAQRYKVQNKN